MARILDCMIRYVCASLAAAALAGGCAAAHPHVTPPAPSPAASTPPVSATTPRPHPAVDGAVAHLHRELCAEHRRYGFDRATLVDRVKLANGYSAARAARIVDQSLERYCPS